MNVHESVLDAIGNTPLVRLNHVGTGLAPRLYAKVEYLSVGGSVKDRAALSMVLAAERDGSLQPGGTIVEGTSGNTGIGLTIVGRQRDYRVVVGVPDKSAKEKVDILKAYGAEVVIAPTALPKQHPDHLFNVVRRIVDETPGAWLANQYDNPANPAAHLDTTGPELWRQTQGRITHLVGGIGTGGTITGTGRYLKDVSRGRVCVVGADPENSTYAGGDGSPYYTESIGHFVHPQTDEDLWPRAFDPGVVDRYEQISDRDALLTARRLARDEGLLVGASSGAAVAAALRVAEGLGADDVVVVILPDSGRSYLSKFFNDDWLLQWGFLQARDELTVGAVAGDLVYVDTTATVADAVALAAPVLPVVLARPRRDHGIAATEVVGSIRVDGLAAGDPVLAHLGPPLPVVGIGEPVAVAAARVTGHGGAVVARDGRAVALVSHAALWADSPRRVPATTPGYQQRSPV